MRYGARLTHRWKGWLFTALATTALLAMSAGTALAQVTDVDVRSVSISPAPSGVVQENSSAEVTVVLNKALPSTAGATVTLAVAYPDATGGLTGTQGTRGNAEDGSGAGDVIDVVVSTTLQIAGGSDRGSVTVSFGNDLDAVDENFGITAVIATVTGSGATISGSPTTQNTGTIKIDDDEEQEYVMTVTSAARTILEGDTDGDGTGNTVDLTMVARPARPANETMTLHLGVTRGYSVTTPDAGVTVDLDTTTPATGEAITVTVPINDENRTDDLVTVTAHSGSVVRSTQVTSVEFTVLDIHQLPAANAITGEARSNKDRNLGSVVTAAEEGDTVYLWVTVANRATGDRVSELDAFKVAVTAANPAQALDYRITNPDTDTTTAGGSTSGKRVGPWVLELLEDEDVGMETLMLSLDVTGSRTYGSGTSSGTFSLSVEDTTAKKIEPKATDADYDRIKAAIAEGAGDEGLNPGEMVTLMTSDLFTVAEGYTASYGVSVEGDAASASASGSTVTITAMQAGDAKITVTGTARHAGSSLETSQTMSNVAELTFPVTVVDKDLVLTWYVGQGGDDYNIENLVEGQSYEIIVNANRAITEAEGSVEVTFMRDRAASDADDSDYTVGTATIRAGRDHAHARPPLMVLADDISEGATDDGGNVGEQLVLFGVASNGATVMPDPEHFSTDNGALTIWDTAVPALPVIATWLLGLGLLGGGARQMYLRRRQD